MPFAPLLGRRLLFLEKEKRSYGEGIHVGSHEAAPGVFRGADNRLTTDIERGVDDNGAAGLRFEAADQFMIEGVRLTMDGLHASRVVHMGHSRER